MTIKLVKFLWPLMRPATEVGGVDPEVERRQGLHKLAVTAARLGIPFDAKAAIRSGSSVDRETGRLMEIAVGVADARAMAKASAQLDPFARVARAQTHRENFKVVGGLS